METTAKYILTVCEKFYNPKTLRYMSICGSLRKQVDVYIYF